MIASPVLQLTKLPQLSVKSSAQDTLPLPSALPLP